MGEQHVPTPAFTVAVTKGDLREETSPRLELPDCASLLGRHNEAPGRQLSQQTYSLPVLEAGVRDAGEGGLVPPEASLPGVHTACVFSLCPQVISPLCVSGSRSPLLIGTPATLDYDLS